jgi:hypothetical protein
LSVPSIMRLPEIVLTTIFKKPFSTLSYYRPHDSRRNRNAV